MKRILLPVLAGLILILPVAAQPKKAKAGAAPAAATTANVDGITEAQLRDYLYFIASDEMEGRDTPSRGLDTTAKFIGMMLSRWGYQPAGDNGTYYQKIKLSRDKVEGEKSSLSLNGQTFKYGDDFLSQGPAGMGTYKAVYAGNGWFIKGKMDAYQSGSSRLDVRDKIVIISSAGQGLPGGISFRELQGMKRGEDWMDPVSYAAKNGAKAIITLPNFQTISNWQRQRARAGQAGGLRPEGIGGGNMTSLPSALVSLPVMEALFSGERESAGNVFSKAGGGEPLPGFELNKSITLNFASKTEVLYTQNVVAIYPGSDPVLKNEYVAIGAHYDHVGIGQPDASGDAIYNGADDDGSGTTGVLGIAEALAKGTAKPKRSILFVWHCGEEKGLWGSEYFTNHPTVDLKQVVTQLNIDMIGRSKKEGDTNPRNKELSGPDEIYVIGSKMMSSELGDLSEKVNNGYLKLKFDYRYDDPKDPNRFFFRSDHFNYAQKGVPIIFYFDGVHEDYHRPGDQPEKIDYKKMEKVARTVLATAWELANQAGRPKIDKQLPPELTNR